MTTLMAFYGALWDNAVRFQMQARSDLIAVVNFVGFLKSQSQIEAFESIETSHQPNAPEHGNGHHGSGRLRHDLHQIAGDVVGAHTLGHPLEVEEQAVA